MTRDEIKKTLYTRESNARLVTIRKGKATYCCEIFNEPGEGMSTLLFVVPFTDMGDATFLPTMKAKHLIRWLITKDHDNSKQG